MYEAYRRFHHIVGVMAPNLSIAQHIDAGFINDIICKLEHVNRSTVQNIKRKLIMSDGLTTLKKVAKTGAFAHTH